MFKYIKAMLQHVKPDASPGVPLANLEQTNFNVMNVLGDQLVELILLRIDCLLSKTVDNPKQMLAEFLCDPVRLFVKGEPHKVVKILEGRVRLIMSVSLMDKVIEMVLHNHVNKHEIANWQRLPYKPGMGFTHEMNMHIYETF